LNLEPQALNISNINSPSGSRLKNNLEPILNQS